MNCSSPFLFAVFLVTTKSISILHTLEHFALKTVRQFSTPFLDIFQFLYFSLKLLYSVNNMINYMSYILKPLLLWI